jgi:hypothetical protein
MSFTARVVRPLESDIGVVALTTYQPLFTTHYLVRQTAPDVFVLWKLGRSSLTHVKLTPHIQCECLGFLTHSQAKCQPCRHEVMVRKLLFSEEEL